MIRSLDSLIPLVDGQPSVRKRNDKALDCRMEGEANSRAATSVNAVAASSTPPAIMPTQLELFPGRACPPEAKPAMGWITAKVRPTCRDGVQGGGTRRQCIKTTGETLFGLVAEPPIAGTPVTSREAYKGDPRSRRNNAGQGVGGGHSTGESRDNREEGRTAASIKRTRRGKAAGLPRPRKGRLNPGVSRINSQNDWIKPANFNGRYIEWPRSSHNGDLPVR